MKNISLNESDYQMAPCLKKGLLAKAGEKLVLNSRSLGNNAVASVLKTWCVAYSLKNMEDIFSQKGNPAPKIVNLLENLNGIIEDFKNMAIHKLGSEVSYIKKDSLEKSTGKHYGELFSAFDASSYWKEPLKLLSQRLARNGLNPKKTAKGKLVLDAGCGGGRYSVAWKLLGADSVIGLDFSTQGIEDAQKRVEEKGIKKVKFIKGDVLNIPFDDNSFDIVFSNGVLHHTSNWKKGIKEIVRVLKPEGFGWLYLIESPGGLFWDLSEILRIVMKGINLNVARNSLYLIGIPPNRVFYILDHIMVPINIRLGTDEIEKCLKQTGATNIRRLKRGVDFNRIEQIFQKKPYAKTKYGIGENRYIFTKTK